MKRQIVDEVDAGKLSKLKKKQTSLTNIESSSSLCLPTPKTESIPSSTGFQHCYDCYERDKLFEV